jgi:hypothetical protein
MDGAPSELLKGTLKKYWSGFANREKSALLEVLAARFFLGEIRL